VSQLAREVTRASTFKEALPRCRSLSGYVAPIEGPDRTIKSCRVRSAMFGSSPLKACIRSTQG
jgi:hypothetical protein